MKIAIVDDEEDARYILRTSLEELLKNDADLIVELDGVESAVSFLSNTQVDVVFLDIKMNDGTGFEILERLPNLSSKVVFVTAYDEFALRAFDVFAFAYLVKPFKNSVLKDVINRIKNLYPSAQQDKIAVLSDNYKKGRLDKIVVPEIDGFQVIQLSDVVFLKSDNNYTEFHLHKQAPLLVSKTLKDYERLLGPEGFFRIHRSYLINISFVKSYSKVDGGSIIMKGGKQIPIGRRRLSEFRRLFLG